MTAKVQVTADVASSAEIGDGTKVWDYAQVREGAVVGSDCVVGRGVYIGPGVNVGDRCKIQNGALVYEPARLARGVFVGPGAVFTNDRHPRATTPDGGVKAASDWTAVGVVCDEGSSVGAGAVCVAPVRLGRWSLVAAGSVVVKDVPDFAVVAGNPARQIGWVGRAAVLLVEDARPGEWRCPRTGERYVEIDGVMTEVDR